MGGGRVGGLMGFLPAGGGGALRGGIEGPVGGAGGGVASVVVSCCSGNPFRPDGLSSTLSLVLLSTFFFVALLLVFIS